MLFYYVVIDAEERCLLNCATWVCDIIVANSVMCDTTDCIWLYDIDAFCSHEDLIKRWIYSGIMPPMAQVWNVPLANGSESIVTSKFNFYIRAASYRDCV